MARKKGLSAQASPNNGTVASAGQYEIQKEDTVKGQLESFNNYSDPVFKRAGSIGRRLAASRGLTNSTIATGNVAGAVLDKAVDIASTDANNRVSAGISNAQNITSASGTTASNAAQIQTTNINANTELEATRIREKNANERLASQIESAEREGALGRTSQTKNLREQLASQERISRETNAQRTLDRQVTRENIQSNERIATQNNEAADRRAALERENRILIQSMGQEAAANIEALRNQFQIDRDTRQEVSGAWDNLQQGIAQIDPNASSSSQQTQYNRLMEQFRARMGFLGISPTTGDPVSNTPIVGGTNFKIPTGGNISVPNLGGRIPNFNNNGGSSTGAIPLTGFDRTFN